MRQSQKWTGQISTANTNLDGTGTIVSLITAPLDGVVIKRRQAVAKVTTTAGWVSWFIKKGSTWELDCVMPVYAATVGSTVPPFFDGHDVNIVLLEGEQYGAATYAAEAMIASIETEPLA